MIWSFYSTTLQLARENGVPLMFTLPQLSYWSAKHLGDMGLEAMKERLQGWRERPATDGHSLRDRQRHHRGEGKQGVAGQARPADPLSVEAKGRFEPVTVNKWLDDHTISVPSSMQVDDTGAGQSLKKK